MLASNSLKGSKRREIILGEPGSFSTYCFPVGLNGRRRAFCGLRLSLQCLHNVYIACHFGKPQTASHCRTSARSLYIYISTNNTWYSNCMDRDATATSFRLGLFHGRDPGPCYGCCFDLYPCLVHYENELTPQVTRIEVDGLRVDDEAGGSLPGTGAQW